MPVAGIDVGSQSIKVVPPKGVKAICFTQLEKTGGSNR
jgi:hypothetical protein